MKIIVIVSTCIFSAFMMFGCLEDSTVSSSNKNDELLTKLIADPYPPTIIGGGYSFQVDVPVYSPDKSTKLVFQKDGNLVFYKGNDWQAQSHTYDHVPRPDRAIFQTDGNLVLYAGNKPVWNSQTWGMRWPQLKIYGAYPLGVDQGGGKLYIIDHPQALAKTQEVSPPLIWGFDYLARKIIFKGYKWPNW